MPTSQEKRSWLDRPISSLFPPLTVEVLLFSLIVVLVAVSRLYALEVRTMSHDESLHVYFSWLLFRGQGYQHTPMMHGPLQFHLLALTYFLFGDSDFTARLPHAIASILTVILLWKWRRYLGQAGALVAAGLMLISPYMLYYGRYARNEAFVGLFGVLTLYAILRYLETGKARYLFLLTAATVLHFTSKETAFIYTAQALLFLAIFLILRVTRVPWKDSGLYNSFIVALSVGVLFLGAALGLTFYNRTRTGLEATQTAPPLVPNQEIGKSLSLVAQLPPTTILIIIASLAFLAGAFLLIFGYGWKRLRSERSFDLLMLIGTLVLPQLAALPIRLFGWNPLDYSFTWPGWNLEALFAQGPVRTAAVLLFLIVLSVALGLLWNKKLWIWNAVLFYSIYIFFYTTFFTNWQGFFTGIVGSLGYWLEQQDVHRGSQPWYYYLLIQIPIYEFLPAIGLCIAAYLGIRRKKPAPLPREVTSQSRRKGPPEAYVDLEPASQTEGNHTFNLLLWWSLSSLVIFTIAGEKMPWLTYHIALPMILITGWAVGQVIQSTDWKQVWQKRGSLAAVLLTVLAIGIAGALVIVVGPNPPFQGKTLIQLAASAKFLLFCGTALGSAIGLIYLLRDWDFQNGIRLGTLVVLGLLAILTARTSLRATFINYDNATEYLVYAHGARGVQDIMEQIERISSRIAGVHNLVVAYDASSPDQGVSWPFKWYLRDYPNARTFDQPLLDLRDAPVIIVDQKNFDTIRPIVSDQYYRFDYLRMVWPNQDYFGLTWQRIWNAVKTPKIRAGLFEIWFNRDYSLYAQATNSSWFTLPAWEPSDKMQLYIRKDIAQQMWEYGIGQSITVRADPYEKGVFTLPAELVFGTSGQSEGQFSNPHGIALAPDGSLYVADTNNNRIQHFSPEGVFINAWGSFGDSTVAPAAIGTFNQPWDVAVSPDGRWVYVTDTWNHRVEKFTSDGTPVLTWGHALFGKSDDPFGLWGPRGIAVDGLGRVYVADTGNKRILVYNEKGEFITEFGEGGMQPGQFEEPVGLALDSQGKLYVADTWNQRVQVFQASEDVLIFTPLRQWEIAGWYGDSLENKPFLAVDNQRHIFITDPEGSRVLEFTTEGEFIRTWGDYGSGESNFGLASAVATDSQGRVWVSDGANNRIMRFTLP